MRIRQFETTPIAFVPYVGAGPRQEGPIVCQLPIYHAIAQGLPDTLDALIVTSDLQGRELTTTSDEGRLLGVALAESILTYLDPCVNSRRVGVLLCGDLYAEPDSNCRGGIGDVTDVWSAFAEHFAWVVGVAGNHDSFEPGPGLANEPALQNAKLLDGDTHTVSGLLIGGVSGITGNPNKPNRKHPSTYVGLLDQVVCAGCDAVLLHESPLVQGARRGSAVIRDYLELVGRRRGDAAPLVVCGHTWWENPVAELRNGVQILNVDHRVVVLTSR